MKYKINFSNYDKSKELQKKLFSKIYWGSVFFLFILFFYGFYKFYYIGKEIKRVKQELMELNVKLERAKEERKRIISDKEEIILKNKIKFYEELKKDRLTQTVFFNIIEERTPRAIKLISLDFDISRRSFIINGETLNPDIVVSYLSELQKVDIFKKVTLTRQTMQKGTDKKVIIGNFEIRGELI